MVSIASAPTNSDPLFRAIRAQFCRCRNDLVVILESFSSTQFNVCLIDLALEPLTAAQPAPGRGYSSRSHHRSQRSAKASANLIQPDHRRVAAAFIGMEFPGENGIPQM